MKQKKANSRVIRWLSVTTIVLGFAMLLITGMRCAMSDVRTSRLRYDSLFPAVGSNFSIKVEEAIMKFGRDPNETNDAGETLLIAATKQSNIATMRVLLQLCANPELKDKTGRTALDWAIAEDRQEAMRTLTESRARK